MKYPLTINVSFAASLSWRSTPAKQSAPGGHLTPVAFQPLTCTGTYATLPVPYTLSLVCVKNNMTVSPTESTPAHDPFIEIESAAGWWMGEVLE